MISKDMKRKHWSFSCKLMHAGRIRRMKPSIENRKNKFKGTNKLKNVISLDAKFKTVRAETRGKGVYSLNHEAQLGGLGTLGH